MMLGDPAREIALLWARIVGLSREIGQLREENTQLRRELDEVVEREREERGWQG